MTSSASGPGEGHPLPPSADGRLTRLRRFVVATLPGRLLVGGAAAKGLAALGRLLTDGEPVVVALVDTLGGVALIGSAGYLLSRLIVTARRRLLWRVRRKLILSYIFIGVVPALLIVSFFFVSGLILSLNVASYMVTDGIGNVTNEAVYLARVTALEIQRGPGPQAAAPILEQREAALASRYPSASIALIPTVGAEPCVGGPAVGPQAGQVPGLLAASREVVTATPAGPASPGRARPAPLSVGHWDHVSPPIALPPWVSCAGFGGIVVEPFASPPPGGSAGGQAQRNAQAIAIIRGVGLPDAPRPAFAVVVDIPKDEGLDEHLREETSIKVGGVSVVLTDALRARLRSPTRALDGFLARRPAANPGGKRRQPWVVLLQGTDWEVGRPVQTTANIEVNIADIYDRLSATQVGGLTFGSKLLVFLIFLGVLFLIIEAAALVMGLTLARSITGAVHELFEGTERVRQGDFSHPILVRSGDQLGDLAGSFNDMTESIEGLLRQAAEKKRLEEELRIARDIQMSLLPRESLAVPGLSATSLCVPAREVGGDYYDFFPLGDDRLGVLIADVSGKGTSAALYMAELKGLMLSLSQTCPSPRELMLTANRIISRHLDSRSFITMTYAVVDLAARTMTYARAGHTPLIYRRGGAPGDATVEILAPDGLVLGLRIDDGEIFTRLLHEATLPLGRGDLLMFYTDGISEAMNADGDLFGEARLGTLVEEHGHLPVEELRERILREIDAFVAGAPQNDDMTMILLKFDEFVPGAVRTGFADGRF